ncbi:MAG: hypothetical protein J6W82_00195 [Bacteroidales bacterium]|nr:hypothetical protein [Bacteroidales bacterium]
MVKKILHIMLLAASVLLYCGCTDEPFYLPGGTFMELTVSCDDTPMTRAVDKDGETTFNENLIKSVDFLFYPGANPGTDVQAIHHIRKELGEEPIQDGQVTFNMVLKKDIVNIIFTQANEYKATVYALVNFDEDFIFGLSDNSLGALAATRITTDFAQNESDYVQPKFLMDGLTVVTYDENSEPNISGEIDVKRFASKLTVAISVANSVTLKHLEALQEQDEIWTPVLHTMRLYLVDGVKTVLLSGNGSTIPDPEAIDSNPEFFSYKDNRRPYLNDSNVPYLATETSGEKVYYNTWPMYTYPREWSSAQMDYSVINYTQGLPPEQPYFKLEMDWRREAQNGYTYDRRKYYYKIFIPFDEFKRNNWYGFYLDVAILGSETDEGKAILEPSCYLLDWQNKSFAINKFAVISKARYLSVEKTQWSINNLETLTIPFLSSHNVVVVDGTEKATRPYYGVITTTEGERVGDYNEQYHAKICENADGSYYLDYSDQPAGNEAYDPKNWLTNTSTSIRLDHPLQNNYLNPGFDYSPYTIEFDIVHSDLADEPQSHTYQQYLRHITITQYPAIYINALQNSDTQIKKIGSVYGYSTGSAPWLDKPWGYVYVNGGRFIRYDNKSSGQSADPYWKLSSDKSKKEYQWQAVWYTGGGTDIINIHVTVLPSGSSFVIGDPREDGVNNLDDAEAYPDLYQFTTTNENDIEILERIRDGEQYPGGTRTGFNKAPALYGDSYRSLQWYHPTEKSTRTENMLSPGYRISTKLGGTEYGNLSKNYAEYRCAAYQEDGFPAGRWRLPTKAEINFIAQLSAKKVFEYLFTTGTGSATYWSANGAVTVNADTGTVTNSSVNQALLRCVYDSWYWDAVDGLEGDPRHNPRDRFIWGDKE